MNICFFFLRFLKLNLNILLRELSPKVSQFFLEKKKIKRKFRVLSCDHKVLYLSRFVVLCHANPFPKKRETSFCICEAPYRYRHALLARGKFAIARKMKSLVGSIFGPNLVYAESNFLCTVSTPTKENSNFLMGNSD